MISGQQGQRYSTPNGLGNLLKKRLKRMACEVELARDGDEGLCMFAKGNYDVVITYYNFEKI